MTPLVSILLPVHDGAAFVRTAIASALAQSIHDLEIIAVDDGSTDRTWEVLSACAREDARVIPLRRAENRGPACARNLAIAEARGTWLALLDADDAFRPGRLIRLVAGAEERGADLLADNLILRDFVTGAPRGYAFSTVGATGPLGVDDLLARDSPTLPIHSRFGFAKPIIRGDFLRRTGIRYHEDIRAGSDFLFYCECALHGGRFHYDPYPGYIFAVRDGSVSNRRELTRYHSLANQRILGLAQNSAPAVQRALHRRQTLIDFDCFRISVGTLRHDLTTSLSLARCLPVPYLLRRVSRAAVRRLASAITSDEASGDPPRPA